MNREDLFKDQLRASGERITTPRLGIFRALVRFAPLSMAMLITRAQAAGIDPVTTYRTINLFRRLGLIQELGLGRNRLLELGDEYDTHHHHFTCSQCGSITDFDSDIIETDLHRMAERLGLELRAHQLEATGLCAACRS